MSTRIWPHFLYDPEPAREQADDEWALLMEQREYEDERIKNGDDDARRAA